MRRQFGFEQASLDTVTRRLGREGKVLEYDIGMAEAALGGDKKAQKTLRKYNENDVLLTEWLSDRLRGYMPGHTLVPVEGGGGLMCNQCYSTDLKPNGHVGRDQLVYELFRCNNCRANVRGNWSTGRMSTGRGV